jgi:hypothetical protein
MVGLRESYKKQWKGKYRMWHYGIEIKTKICRGLETYKNYLRMCGNSKKNYYHESFITV